MDLGDAHPQLGISGGFGSGLCTASYWGLASYTRLGTVAGWGVSQVGDCCRLGTVASWGLSQVGAVAGWGLTSYTH